MTRRRIARLLWLWGPPVAFAAAIFIVSSIPIKRTPFLFKNQDKAAHFAEYAVFAALLARAFLPGRRLLSAAALTLAVSILMGAGDELHQALVPGRDACFLDAAADAAGAFAGAAFALLVSRLCRIAGRNRA